MLKLSENMLLQVARKKPWVLFNSSIQLCEGLIAVGGLTAYD
jgi:hypothetical protein